MEERDRRLIRLEKIEMPAEVRAGEPFDIAVEFVLLDDLPVHMNRLAVHLFREDAGGFEKDLHRVNADCYIESSRAWTPGEVVRIDVISPTLFSDQPPGAYLVAVIFHAAAEEEGKRVRYNYLYENPEIGRDCVVGRIRVLPPRPA